MQILIISDIHANLTALEAVLAAAGEFDAVWCLGDLVGYGPDPNEVIQIVRKLPNLQCLIGNHDAAALDQIDPSAFNLEARQAVSWTQKALHGESLAYLQTLPEKIELEEVTLCHGSPRFPIWEYLLDTRTATLNFSYFNTPYCFVGHTHLPVIFSLDESKEGSTLHIPEPNTILELRDHSIVNPGSVGQPRDRDPRAAFALYNPSERTWDYRRIEYDIQSVQARMAHAGLPVRHIKRLSVGW